jgi:hypothetical protein
MNKDHEMQEKLIMIERLFSEIDELMPPDKELIKKLADIYKRIGDFCYSMFKYRLIENNKVN